MRKFLWLSILFLMFALNHPAFAALATVDTTWGADDVREVNNATPGTSKTFLGTRLKGPITIGATTYAANENLYPISSNCQGNVTTPTTTVFLKTTGAVHGEAYCLGNAVIPGTTQDATNQRLTVVLVTDGGTDLVVTPNTKTGFTNAVLNDAKDSVTFRYINSTVGWTIEGNNGATIN